MIVKRHFILFISVCLQSQYQRLQIRFDIPFVGASIGYHSAVISILISIKVVHSIYCGDPTGLMLKVEQKVKLVV